MKPRHYLDHAATSPLRPEAKDAILQALAIDGNPSSVHSEGRQARRAFEDARRRLAGRLGVAPARLVVTGCASESNAAILSQFSGRVLVSSIEHPSVLFGGRAAPRIEARADGRLCLDHLQRLLSENAVDLVSTMAVNNETGVVQPIGDIRDITNAFGVPLHVDAVQALGRQPIDLRLADFWTFSAHKIGGPKGVGLAVIPDDGAWKPLLGGGGQERNRRSGTENVLGLAGFAAALDAIDADEPRRIDELRRRFEQACRQIDGATIIAESSRRAPHITSVALPGLKAETLIMQLDLAGIAVSAGSACSSGKVQRSHVLDAMGLADKVAEATVRVSFGWNSRAKDVDAIVAQLIRVQSNRA